MRILFIRHGEPDYVKDCLTERGKIQAERAAERLQSEGIDEIYASPMGRAYGTAEYTAKRLGLPITVLDYMHEVSWGGEGIPAEGHLWTLSDWMLEEGFDPFREDWRKHPYFEKNTVMEYYDRLGDSFGELLLSYGYRQEGNRFFCSEECDKTIAVFSHGGSGACVLSRILSLPFPYMLCVLPYDFTSIISVELPSRKDSYVHARLELFNDAAHIHDISDGLKIQQKAVY
ncbi:MAG: histidine phosphatase family protein [Eubacterium sp.]|nr:histidine phosphatase family protein [Eubacterium sp.]